MGVIMDKLIAIIIDKLDWKHTYKNRIAAMNLIIHWLNSRYALLPSMRDELDEIEELEDISVVESSSKYIIIKFEDELFRVQFIESSYGGYDSCIEDLSQVQKVKPVTRTYTEYVNV